MAASRRSVRAVRSRLGRLLRPVTGRLRPAPAPQPVPIPSAGAQTPEAAASTPVHGYPSLVAELRHLRWGSSGDLELDGWTYLATAPARRGEVRVWATVVGSDETWTAAVTPRTDLEANVFARTADDVSPAGWAATFAVADLDRLLGGPGTNRSRDGYGSRSLELQVWVELAVAGQLHRSPLTKNYRWGSADALPGRVVRPDWWMAGAWRGADGLVLSLRSDAVVVEHLTLTGQQVAVDVRALGEAAPTSLLLSAGSSAATPFGAGPTQQLRTTAAELPAKDPADLIWVAANGTRHRVLAHRPPLQLSGAPVAGVAAAVGVEGGLSLARQRRLVQLVGLTLTGGSEPSLRLSGTLAGVWPDPVRLELRGARDVFSVVLDPVDGSFQAELPMLRTDAWGHDGLAPMPGGYRLWAVDGAGAKTLVQLSPELMAGLHSWEFNDHFSARIEHHPDNGGLWLNVLDPRPLAEIGPYARKRLRARHQKGDTVAAVEDAVYFESFVGESCACNPKAVHDEIARRNLGLKLYWGVQDRSVPVPAGATAVTINSAEWWRVRHQARYLVTNDWLNDTFKHRSHQRVLQTWHGTALKLLALDRPKAREDAAFVRAIQTENAKWDLLLAENAYSVDLMRRAYEYEGRVLESGYPRNDLLTSPRATEVRAELRNRLGIGADQRVVLYAPTWREDRTAMVDDLDVLTLAKTLGEEYVILLRGHAKTLRGNAERQSDRVVNVTSYPDVSDLFCAADVCVTDYSSVMFDFTVTGKPLLFFTPDYDSYVNALRGVYFDLSEVAPGPMLTSPQEMAEAIVHSTQARADFDERYRAWTVRFNAWDDGSASARATDALLAL